MGNEQNIHKLNKANIPQTSKQNYGQRRTEIENTLSTNKIHKLYPTSCKVILFTSPFDSVRIYKDGVLKELNPPNASYFNAWNSLFFETIESAQEFAKEYPTYNFLILDISSIKPKVLKIQKEHTKKIIEVEETEEIITGIMLEDIGDN